MKHAKKLASLLLALVMVLAMGVTSFAAGETGTITIENAVKDQTYTVYQILDLESYNLSTNAYLYKATTDDWSKFINGSGIKGTYVDVDTQGYVTWIDGASAADFAKKAKEYADQNSITPGYYDNAVSGREQFVKVEPVKATGGTVEFSGLDLGYYLVDSTMGTLCSLDTTNPNATVEEKNVEPTNDKEIKEGNNESKTNDAAIGDTVNFTSTITLPKGSENVVFHDEMSQGLTLDANSIKVYTNEAMTTELAIGNYTVTRTGLTDDCTFEVSFKKTYLDGLTADTTTVYVGYSATLNANAVVAGEGNKNESKLSYGEEGKSETTPSETKTYTWSFDVLKYANGNEDNVLKGVQFVLLNNDKTKVAKIVDGKLTEWGEVPTANDDGTIGWIDWHDAGAILTTNDQGKIAIAGLDSGTYYLREIQALSGYNKLTDDVEVKIEPTKNETTGALTLKTVIAKVENKSGNELPSTGGMGTTIFYVLGTILLLGSAVLLITRRRMNAEK